MPAVDYGIYNLTRNLWYETQNGIFTTTSRHVALAQLENLSHEDAWGNKYEIRRMDGKSIRTTGPSETK